MAIVGAVAIRPRVFISSSEPRDTHKKFGLEDSKNGGFLLSFILRRIPGLFVLAVFAELAGCASTTSGGAVNVDRTQLLLVSAATVNAQSALAFNHLTTEASKKRLLNNDQALTQRIRDISNRLIAQTTIFRADARQWGWEVHVIEDKDLNAFCMPGGKIMVNTGLVTRLALSDDEIAAVIGHEISHALREHGREKMSQRTLTEAIVKGVAAGSNASNANMNATLASAGAQLFVSLPYSRSMESEADVMGLELMARAGFDPRNAPGVWRKMSQVGGKDNTPAFLRTHPTNDSRLDGLAAAMPKVIAVYSPKSRQTPTDVSTGDANFVMEAIWSLRRSPVNLEQVGQPDVIPRIQPISEPAIPVDLDAMRGQPHAQVFMATTTACRPPEPAGG